MLITHARLAALTGLAALVTVAGCAQPPVQVEGVKITATPTPTVSTEPPLQTTADGGLAVRLLPPTLQAKVGQPTKLTVEYVDRYGGLVGTVEDFGDGGLGGLKISDCRDSEQNPSTGTKGLTHTWARPGTYRVSVTVSTLSCVHGQEDVTATGTVTVR